MKKITKTALAILLSLCLCIGMVPAGMLSAGAANGDSEPVGFSPDNFKAQIKKVSIGAPITGLDGKKYLPVDVHFFAAENLSDSDVAHFLEGYLKVQLKDGKLAESIRSLGMTLIGPVKPDVTLDSNMWNWDWTPFETGGGQGVIKYNVPLLEESETQSVERSQATGMTEVNGVKVGDEITLQNETVVNTNNIPEQIVQELFPDGPSVFSDPVTFTVEEASKYPKEITISTDDKTVAPPEEVVLPYTGQPQECPYKATAGYTVSLNDPQTDAGIYTAALILNSGWKWTDGTTEAKPAVWAINKATITSVTLSANQLTYNGKDQTPMITSVKAGDLTVPANGYTATFPEPSNIAAAVLPMPRSMISKTSRSTIPRPESLPESIAQSAPSAVMRSTATATTAYSVNMWITATAPTTNAAAAAMSFLQQMKRTISWRLLSCPMSAAMRSITARFPSTAPSAAITRISSVPMRAPAGTIMSPPKALIPTLPTEATARDARS